jgi:hypothetical protein
MSQEGEKIPFFEGWGAVLYIGLTRPEFIGYRIVLVVQLVACYCVHIPEVGTRKFFFESAIVFPQLEGSTSAITIPQLLKKYCSTIAIFSEVGNFKSAT